MRTALAADEPEPERPPWGHTAGATVTYIYAAEPTSSWPIQHMTVSPYMPTREALAKAAGSDLPASVREAFIRGAGSVDVTTATFPQQIIGPWQCPECKAWMAPHVREHRCE